MIHGKPLTDVTPYSSTKCIRQTDPVMANEGCIDVSYISPRLTITKQKGRKTKEPQENSDSPNLTHTTQIRELSLITPREIGDSHIIY